MGETTRAKSVLNLFNQLYPKTREAPTKDPRTSKVEDATLEAEAEAGLGVGAGASVEAMTALIEVAMQKVFFKSMVMKRLKDEGNWHLNQGHSWTVRELLHVAEEVEAARGSSKAFDFGGNGEGMRKKNEGGKRKKDDGGGGARRLLAETEAC
ncbi:hypothetical protein REPUB_Repub13aG0143200 [Reevesia pubescens]